MTLIIALAVLGALLIFAETLLMWGVLFAAGAVVFAAAAVAAFFEAGVAGSCVVVAAFGVSCVSAMLVWTKLIPHTRMAKDVFLKSASDGKSPAPDFSGKVGSVGVAKTPLVPSGVVEIGGECFDAACIEGHCNAGEKVEVVSSAPFGLRVRKI